MIAGVRNVPVPSACQAFPDSDNLTIEQQIRSEIYRAFEILGAGASLVATIGSWGDTLGDEEILRLLKEWNTDEARRGKLASNWF